MNYNQGSRQKNIYDMIVVVKILSLLFCAIIVCSQFFMRNKYINSTEMKNYNMGTFGFMVVMTAIIYCLWMLLLKNVGKLESERMFVVIEDMCFMALFSVLVMISQPYAHQYNFIFLLVIIIGTIQSGMRYGITLAVLSSIIIFAIDLFFCKSPISENIYFESNMILSLVFFITSWILGCYVKMENENMEKKNMQLSKLNKQLNTQKKHRRHVEKMLLKNENCYKLLIDNSKEAIFVHNCKNIIFANESAASIIGFSVPEELNGRSIIEFVPQDEKESINRNFSSICEKKETTLVFEQKIISKDAVVSSVQNTSTYIIYDGKPAILTVFHDITREKQVKKLQEDVEKNVRLLNESREFNKLITQFFANISHELKTPLNVIFSAIQLLELYNDDSHQKKREKYLMVMKHNCYRLMKLINNLLDITKIDSGFSNLKLKNYNIVSVLEDVTSSVRPYLKCKNMTLTFDTDVEEKIMAFDLDKFERIILNLISNCVKFTKDGGHIYVNMMDRGNSVYICIKDTGIGIPGDKLNVIFERFGQVDKTLNRNCEGSGMGLYLVKSFIEMHGGKIEVRSQVGKGSEFIVKLPATVLSEISEVQDTMYENNIEKVDIEFSDIYYDSAVI